LIRLKNREKTEKGGHLVTPLFQIGRKKTGGRKKGTKNKKVLGIQEIINRNYNGFDVVEKMIEVLHTRKLSNDQQLAYMKEIAQYTHAKRKAIELSNSDDEPLRIEHNVFHICIEERINALNIAKTDKNSKKLALKKSVENKG